eukprot:6182321-Pleurochrysis_carterae.AAC.1
MLFGLRFEREHGSHRWRPSEAECRTRTFESCAALSLSNAAMVQVLGERCVFVSAQVPAIAMMTKLLLYEAVAFTT